MTLKFLLFYNNNKKEKKKEKKEEKKKKKKKKKRSGGRENKISMASSVNIIINIHTYFGKQISKKKKKKKEKKKEKKLTEKYGKPSVSFSHPVNCWSANPLKPLSSKLRQA